MYEYNSHDQLRPASITKLMSILLIMDALNEEKIHLEDKVPCSEHAASMGGSQIWLNEDENLSVNDMLKAICVVSANDCVVAMSEFIAGSEEVFVSQMNDKAKELGMNDTCYKNCHGIDEDGHVSSSYDISLLARELLNKYPQITEYTSIWMDTLRDGKSQLTNTNRLVRTYDGCTGLKTGSTSLALYNLAASATRNNLSLIAVVLKAPTSDLRFSETKKLLNYGFSNYTFEKTSTQGDFFQSIDIEKGVDTTVNLVFESSTGSVIKNSDKKDITSNVELNESISAPIQQGDILGKITFYSGEKEISSTNLVAESDVKKISVISFFEKITSFWINLFR